MRNCCKSKASMSLYIIEILNKQQENEEEDYEY